MANILFLGGTKFFGILLAEKLLLEGHNLIILSRVKELPEVLRRNERVQHICADISFKENESPDDRSARIANLVLKNDISIVIDNVSWQAGEVSGIIKALYESGKSIEQYILCSSVAVYNNWNQYKSIEEWINNGLKEDSVDLNASGYQPNLPSSIFSDFYSFYADGKRASEREIIEDSSKYGFSYTIMRPVVIEGYNDPHNRTWYWVQRLLDRKEILIPHTETMTFYRHVCSQDVANAFFKAVGNKKAFNQIFNIAGEEILTVEEYIFKLADSLNLSRDEVNLVPVRKAEICEKINGFEFPPFFYGFAFISDIEKSKTTLGYCPTTCEEWMGIITAQLSQMLNNLPNSLGYEKREEEINLANSLINEKNRFGIR